MTAPHPEDGKDRFIRVPEVCEMIGISRATLYSWENKGILPKSTILGERVKVWRKSRIKQWMNDNEANLNDGDE